QPGCEHSGLWRINLAGWLIIKLKSSRQELPYRCAGEENWLKPGPAKRRPPLKSYFTFARSQNVAVKPRISARKSAGHSKFCVLKSSVSRKGNAQREMLCAAVFLVDSFLQGAALWKTGLSYLDDVARQSGSAGSASIYTRRCVRHEAAFLVQGVN